jgi:hypothetical protein
MICNSKEFASITIPNPLLPKRKKGRNRSNNKNEGSELYPSFWFNLAGNKADYSHSFFQTFFIDWHLDGNVG